MLRSHSERDALARIEAEILFAMKRSGIAKRLQRIAGIASKEKMWLIYCPKTEKTQALKALINSCTQEK